MNPSSSEGGKRKEKIIVLNFLNKMLKKRKVIYLYCNLFFHHTVRQTCAAAVATGVVAACSVSRSMSKRLLETGASYYQTGKKKTI